MSTDHDLPYRSKCDCPCHTSGAHMMHCFPCCEPDPEKLTSYEGSITEDYYTRGLGRTADALDMGNQLREADICRRCYGKNDRTCMKPKGHKGKHGKAARPS